MKKNIKNLLLLMIVLLATLTLTSCSGSFKYPDEIPTISNPKGVYMTVGDYKVTNEQLYYRNLANYGVDVLNALIDDALLPTFDSLTAEEKADYELYRNERIYGVEDISKLDEDEKTELEETYNKTKISQGYYTEGAAEEALKLEYRRFVFASNVVKQEIADFEPVTDDDGEVIQEEYFTETEVTNATAVAYPNESTIILLTFRSELEAKSVMEYAGIYADTFDYRGWHKLVVDAEGNKSAGELLTQTEVYDAFIKMYNLLYNGHGCSIDENAYTKQGDEYVWSLEENVNGYNNFKFNYTELSSVSSTIAKKVFETLTVDKFQSSYTIAPNKYLSKYFLAIELEETIYEDIEYTDSVLLKQLIETKLTANRVDYYLYRNRVEAGLVIYDRGLEIPYAEDFNTIYEALNDETTYEKTELTSKTNVATFNVNGKEVAITADDMALVLNERYGVSTAIGYVSQYIILANSEYNTVYNYLTGEILDKEAYEEIYDEEVGQYKEELENGTFASVGYPAKYGWENFLRDRFGVLDENELLAVGSLYEEALGLYGEARYTFSNDASVAIANLFAKVLKNEITRESYLEQIEPYVEEAENTIQYQMQKIADDFYSVEALTIKAFIDLDHNGVADDLTADAETYGEILVNYLLEEANNESVQGKTYAERLTNLVKKYNLAGINDTTQVLTTTFAELKKMGIEVSISTASTYSSSTQTNEELGAVLKGLWNQVKDGQMSEKFTSTTKSISFTNELISSFYNTETQVSKIVVTKATDYTYTISNLANIQVTPTIALIERYLIVNKDDEDKTDEELELSITTREKAAIEAYYTVALNKLTSEDALGDALIADREALMEVGTVKFTNAADQEKYDILMANID